MRDTYGYIAKESNDPYIEVADAATDQFSRATQAPGYLVDYLPAREYRGTIPIRNPILSILTVRHLPDSFPGTHFKQEAIDWASTLSDMVERPFAYVKQQIVSYPFPVKMRL